MPEMESLCHQDTDFRLVFRVHSCVFVLQVSGCSPGS